MPVAACQTCTVLPGSCLSSARFTQLYIKPVKVCCCQAAVHHRSVPAESFVLSSESSPSCLRVSRGLVPVKLTFSVSSRLTGGTSHALCDSLLFDLLLVRPYEAGDDCARAWLRYVSLLVRRSIHTVSCRLSGAIIDRENSARRQGRQSDHLRAQHLAATRAVASRVLQSSSRLSNRSKSSSIDTFRTIPSCFTVMDRTSGARPQRATLAYVCAPVIITRSHCTRCCRRRQACHAMTHGCALVDPPCPSFAHDAQMFKTRSRVQCLHQGKIGWHARAHVP